MNCKQIFSCAAAVLTALAGLPLPAAAQQPFEYTVLTDGTAEIFCKDTTITTAEIPDTIDGYTVTAIAESGFSGCTALQSVTFPDTLTVIGENAFTACSALTSIAIPEQVTTIGSFVFEGCTALQTIDVEDTNTAYQDDEGVLYTADKKSLLRYPAARAGAAYTVSPACRVIEPWAFTYCSQLQYLETSNVTAIGADAFMYAESLQTVILSEGIEELVGASFAYCVNLRKLTLPSTLQKIGNKCFYGCVSLPSIELPDGLETIGEMAFYGCVQLKEMTIPESVSVIGKMGVGYSVDPETNQNTVISDFKLNTFSGSRGASYAKKNGITHHSTVSQNTLMRWMMIALAVLLLGMGVFAIFYKKHKDAKAYARRLEEERRAKKVQRKQQKKQRKS